MAHQTVVPLACSHCVEFFERDDALERRLVDFIATGLTRGEACLDLASEKSRGALERGLGARGFSPRQLVEGGRLLALDASETLARFLDGTRPDRQRFFAVVTDLLSTIAPARGGLRAYSELVQVLCDAGGAESALDLEQLWNEVISRQSLVAENPFSVLCAYRRDAVAAPPQARWVRRIRALHDDDLASRPMPSPSPAPAGPLRVLVVDGSATDAAAAIQPIRDAGYEVEQAWVATPADLKAALERQPWSVILCDDALSAVALKVVRARGLDLPFLVLSGTIDDENAVSALRRGAHDFLVKGRLARLVPAIERALRDAEHRRAAAAALGELRATEARYRTLLDSMDDVVYTLDRQQRCDGLYGQALAPGGVRQSDQIGKPAREPLGPAQPGPHEEACARALLGERAVYEWSMGVAPAIRHFQTALSPRRDESGRIDGIVGVRRDISDQKRVLWQLMVADRMVTVGTLAAGVAHEINNPLATVAANLDLALRDLSAADSPDMIADVESGLRDAREAADRMRHIVRDIKMFSRVDEGPVGVVELRRVLESTLRMAWNEIRHRARLIKRYGTEHLAVGGNEARLGQVFLNLLLNAAQAIVEGHAEDNEITVTTRADGDRAIVEFRDTGSGIPPEVMERLFSPFFTTKPIGVGTGLGLSISRRIVQELGGDITVETSPGKGSVFRVSLPLARQAALPIAPREPSRYPAGATRRAKVLVVDDEVLVTRTIQRAIERDHDVVCLQGAREALERIKSGERFDVILCDLMMPDMTGMDLHEALLEVAPGQARAMVFVTGGAFTPRARRFLEEAPNQRVDKPFDWLQLRALITDRAR